MESVGYLLLGFFGSGIIFGAAGLIAKKCYDRRQIVQNAVYETRADVVETPMAEITLENNVILETNSTTPATLIKSLKASKIQVAEIYIQNKT